MLALSTITEGQVSRELRRRNYISMMSDIGNGLPSASQSQILAWSVELALGALGYPARQSTPKYLDAMNWGEIVSTSIEASKQLNNQYTVSGLAGLGKGWALGDISWWDTYGPVILQIIGSAATIGGTAWQQQVTRNQINQQIQAATGEALPTGSITDANKLATQLMSTGMSAAEAQARANNIVLGTPLPAQYGGTTTTSGLPSWVLPVGIGVLAFALMQRK
jgi:hypothetical protein